MSIEPESKYKVIGTRPIRHDGIDKVTGTALYGADLNLNNMLYGKILRSPFAHAKIRSIYTTKAESYPGVKAVATSIDNVPFFRKEHPSSPLCSAIREDRCMHPSVSFDTIL